MIKRIFFSIFIISLSNNIQSEECILNDGTANEINKYNQCLSKQIISARNKDSLELQNLRIEIKKLKEENLKLKQKLSQIREILKKIFLNL